MPRRHRSRTSRDVRESGQSGRTARVRRRNRSGTRPCIVARQRMCMSSHDEKGMQRAAGVGQHQRPVVGAATRAGHGPHGRRRITMRRLRAVGGHESHALRCAHLHELATRQPLRGDQACQRRRERQRQHGDERERHGKSQAAQSVHRSTDSGVQGRKLKLNASCACADRPVGRPARARVPSPRWSRASCPRLQPPASRARCRRP